MIQKIMIFLFLLLGLTSCDLWELYEIKFVDVPNNETYKYELNYKDSIITGYKVYINDELFEAAKLYPDSTSCLQVIKDKNNRIKQKRYYYLNVDTLANRTVDTLFIPDSTTIIETRIEFINKGYISKKIVNRFLLFNTVDTINTNYRYFYSKQNINRIEIADSAGKCSDNIEYSTFKNKLDVDNFSITYLGKKTTNLISKIEWKASCNDDENIAISTSTFEYKFDDKNKITEKTETYTPEYNKLTDSRVERTVTKTEYVYNFN